MRYIEVEKPVFDLLFNTKEQQEYCSAIEYRNELTFEVQHLNNSLGIVGRTIRNHVSQTTQYYLKDLNA